jgi:hypothetical protein
MILRISIVLFTAAAVLAPAAVSASLILIAG